MLSLFSTSTGIEIQWNGSHTFNIFNAMGDEVAVFTWYGPEGQPPTEAKARQLMRKRLDELKRDGEWL